MDRRQFLASGAAVGGGLLGDVGLRVARRHLGLWRAPAPPRATPVARDPGLSARVERVDGATASVRLTSSESREPFRVAVVRRTYPTGSVRARATTDLVDVGSNATERTVDVDVPRSASGRDRDPWFYELYARRDRGDDSRAYLGESAPYAWTGAGDAVRAPRVAAAEPPVDDDRFERRRDGNDYALTFRWQDVDDATWTVDYRVRRSTHEAAVDADRGYVTTYEESRQSPIVTHLLAHLDETARRVDADPGAADADSPAGLDSLPPGRRFDALVKYVQYVEYANDADTVGEYDYHRTVEETLVDGVGDCKDRTYLLAGLLHQGFSCRTALLFQSGHVLLGVHPDDVPDLPYDYDAVTVGDDDWVPIEPSLRVPVGYHPPFPFLAVYGGGEWRYADASAIVRGADRVVGTFYDYVV